jgi:hypothetical protein
LCTHKKFYCRRGVWQGDPLSPVLYVLGGYLLQSYINYSFGNGRLNYPIPNRGSNDFPVVQYVDDTIITLQAELDQLNILKDILEEYTAFTGLKVNFYKSSLVPINLQQEESEDLANLIGCTIDQMPFTYLGLPIGGTKPIIRDFSPLSNRVERRLTTYAIFYSIMTYWFLLTLFSLLCQFISFALYIYQWGYLCN